MWIDLACWPECIIKNLAEMPALFKQMFVEAYYGKDVDLNI